MVRYRLVKRRYAFSVSHCEYRGNPLNSIAADDGDFLVQGVCEKKDFLRKKEKEEKSKAKPLIRRLIFKVFLRPHGFTHKNR